MGYASIVHGRQAGNVLLSVAISKLSPLGLLHYLAEALNNTKVGL